MNYGQLQDRGTVRALQTRFGVSPDFNVSLTPELGAVIPLDMPELLFHQGWRRWMAGLTVPAVAAKAARAQFRVFEGSPTNPVTQLVIIERVLVTLDATSNIFTAFGYGPAADLATVTGFGEFRDGRMRPLGAQNTVILSFGTSAVILAPEAAAAGRLANTEYEVPGGPWVFFPANQFLIGVSALNSAMQVTWIWRERPLQEQENT